MGSAGHIGLQLGDLESVVVDLPSADGSVQIPIAVLIMLQTFCALPYARLTSKIDSVLK